MPRKQRLVKERARRLARAMQDPEAGGYKKKGRTLQAEIGTSVKLIARAYTEVAMAELIKLCTRSKSENMRLLAASAILERGWGKPAQAVTGGEADDNPIRHVHEIRETIIDPAEVAGRRTREAAADTEPRPKTH